MNNEYEFLKNSHINFDEFCFSINPYWKKFFIKLPHCLFKFVNSTVMPPLSFLMLVTYSLSIVFLISPFKNLSTCHPGIYFWLFLVLLLFLIFH